MKSPFIVSLFKILAKESCYSPFSVIAPWCLFFFLLMKFLLSIRKRKRKSSNPWQTCAFVWQATWEKLNMLEGSKRKISYIIIFPVVPYVSTTIKTVVLLLVPCRLFGTVVYIFYQLPILPMSFGWSWIILKFPQGSSINWSWNEWKWRMTIWYGQ